MLEVASAEEAIEAIKLLRNPNKKQTIRHQTEYLETKLSELKEREQRLKAVVLPRQTMEDLDVNSEKG
jgi:predicted RecB family endonuclease